MGLDAEIWHVRKKEKRSELEAAYIHGLIEWVKRRTGKDYKTILDVPCGTGRLHPFLRDYGYEVEGFDISEEMVREAQEKGLNVWSGDMRLWESYPNKKYDIILNWFSSFGYFDDETNEVILEIWREHLQKKGILIIDSMTADMPLTPMEVRIYDGKVEIVKQEEKERGIVFKNAIYEDRGSELVLLHKNEVYMRLYSVGEMVELLQSKGLEVLKVFNSYGFSEYREFKRRAEERGKELPPKAVYVAVKR